MSNPGQIVRASDGADNDISAVPAIPAVGAAARNIFLPAEAATASPAIATFDVYRYTIDKHWKK
jgi:hypothetical protein